MPKFFETESNHVKIVSAHVWLLCPFASSLVVGSLHLIVCFIGLTGSGFSFSQSVSKNNNEIQPSLAFPELLGVFAACLTKGDQGESHVASLRLGWGMAESY